MAPYIICFLITGIFAMANDYYLKKRAKLLVIITAIFIILIPAILAGVRSYSIGTDVNFYVLPSFNLARNFHFINDWIGTFNNPMYPTGRMEKGFLLLVYLISRISTDGHFLLFVIAIIIDSFVYFSLYRLRNICSVFIGEVVFLFTQYNASFNMARQSISMGICLYAFSILLANENKKYIRFIIWIIIAMQFHTAAVISFSYLLIYMILGKQNKISLFKKNILIICVILLILLFVPAVQYLVNIGVLNSHYLDYLTGDASGTTAGSISVLSLLVYSSGYIPLLVGVKYLGKYKNIFVLMAIMDVAFMGLAMISFYLYRIAAYFMIIRIVSLSQKSLYSLNSRDSIYTNPYILWLGTIILCVMYFVYFIFLLNWHQTIPFIFMNN